MTITIIKMSLINAVRREAIRLIGVIGAIDPYLIKALENLFFLQSSSMILSEKQL